MASLLALLAFAAVILTGGHNPNVVCGDPPPGALGGYVTSPPTIVMGVTACSDLERFVTGHSDYWTSEAVLGFTHEAMHASMLPDWLDETITECRAISHVRETFYLLGQTDGRQLIRTEKFAVQIHDEIRAEFPAYATAPCDTAASH